MRNYSILSIAIDESRIFLTKERAPFMICVEAFRPTEELALARDSSEVNFFTKKTKSIRKVIDLSEKKLSKAICVRQI